MNLPLPHHFPHLDHDFAALLRAVGSVLLLFALAAVLADLLTAWAGALP